MKKSLGTSILNRAKTAREDRMVETASIKVAAGELVAQDAAEYPAVEVAPHAQSTPSIVEVKALAALNRVAKDVGGTIKNNCMLKDYNGYKFCIQYTGANDSHANFEFSLSKGAATAVKFSTDAYCGSNSECRINTYQMENAQRTGEQAYALGFPIEQGLLIALNMIKLDLSKTNPNKY
jgi:hypothetical protein